MLATEYSSHYQHEGDRQLPIDCNSIGNTVRPVRSANGKRPKVSAESKITHQQQEWRSGKSGGLGELAELAGVHTQEQCTYKQEVQEGTEKKWKKHWSFSSSIRL